MKHYAVISPEIEFRSCGYYEPPEWGCCYVVVEAKNKRDARRKAIKEKGMKEWVDECRSDKKCPLAHLQVIDYTCPHGICECDVICERLCPICEKERIENEQSFEIL